MKYFEAVVFTLAAAAGAVFLYFYPSPKGLLYYASGTAAAAAIAVVYLALGLKILKLFKTEEAAALKYPYAFALAAAFTGTIIFIAGFFRLYNYFFALGFFIACAIASAGEIREMINSLKKAAAWAAEYKTGAAGVFFAVAGAGAFLYIFLASLVPSVYYDTLVYHLAVPQQYLAAGGIVNMRENIFSYFPQLMQMNHLFVLLLTNELGVKLFQFFTGVMALSAAWGLAGMLGADKKTAVLLLVTSPLFMLNTARVGAELPLMLFTLLLLSLVIKALEKSASTGLLALAGVFAGLVISVKYTGVIVCLFAAAAFIFVIIRKKAPWTGLILYLVIPAAVIMPYLLKNYFFTGNPVYPFFTGMFNTEEGLARDAAEYVAHVAGFGLPVTFTNFLVYPFLLVFENRHFGGDIISPLFLAAFLLLPLAGLKKAAVPAVFMFAYLTAWFFTGQVLRFLLPIVPVAAIVFAMAFAGRDNKFRYAALIMLVIPQVFLAFYYSEKYLSPFKVFTQDREEYAAERISYYRAAEFLNKNADRNSVTLVLGEARTFYLEKRALAYTVFNRREALEGFDSMDEKRIIDGLIFRNIKYIMLNSAELERLKDAGFGDVHALVNSAKFNNIMDKYFKKIYSDERCAVYEMKGRQ